jgi:hypothetical protein
MGVPPANGQMEWREALAGPLAGATCLWQDLDGLHVEHAPEEPPYTSILWAWRPDSWLVRVRLDGSTVFVAVHDGNASTATPAVPWDAGDSQSAGDLRVAASRGRGPVPADGGTGAAYEQIIADGIAEGTGPVTFIRPASSPPRRD